MGAPRQVRGGEWVWSSVAFGSLTMPLVCWIVPVSTIGVKDVNEEVKAIAPMIDSTAYDTGVSVEQHQRSPPSPHYKRLQLLPYRPTPWCRIVQG